MTNATVTHAPESVRPDAAPTGLLADAVLPAARFLSGPESSEILRVPVEAAGGVLHSARIRQVQYRPGSDVVVRYSTQVSWHGAPAVRETHLASSTIYGGHSGAVPVTADVNGASLSVGVWRWPFDPVLTGLRSAATPRSAAALCGIDDLSGVALKLVSFRPTDRAVFQLSTPRGTFFLKVVAPRTADAITNRHVAAITAGVPAARVLACQSDLGVIVLEGLSGTMLRDVVKSGTGVLPEASEFDRLGDMVASVQLPSMRAVPARREHAVLHAAMLASVMPTERARLGELSSAIDTAPSTSSECVVHGDLHDGQLLTAGGKITGVLDLDDLGLGSAVDDRANLLGFLRYRAVTRPAMRARLTEYADGLRRASAQILDPIQLDVTTAAVLVGLATGPFRVQHSDWRSSVSSLLDVAETHLDHNHLNHTSTLETP